MKELTCSELGGPETCSTNVTGETSAEMIKNGWDHIQSAHPDLAKNIENNPKEVNDQWMNDFHARFDSLPDKDA